MSGVQHPQLFRAKLARHPFLTALTAIVAVSVLVVGPLALIGGGTAARLPKAAAANPLGIEQLPSPEAPPSSHPSMPAGYHNPSTLLDDAVRQALTSRKARSSDVRLTGTIAPPSEAYTWGSGPSSTLVLYDVTGTWGYLGEEYAMAAGNLATHFGSVTAEPVADYETGQIAQYSATIYIGSTYNEPLPANFLNDVLTTTNPVIWLGDNIWQLSGTGAADTQFQTTYGWDPSTSYFDSTDTITSVTYNGQTLTRSADNGPVLAPNITNSSLVSVLGEANCTTASTSGTTTTYTSAACNEIAQAPGGPTATSFPWAIRSSNLTYVGEVPFSYITATDRYLAFSDLLYDALDPAAPPVHQALVRLEDVSPGLDTPAELEADANYLYSQHVPFSVGVIPDYEDPLGTYNNSVPVSMNISQTSNPVIAAFDAALRYMVTKGGTIIEHGYTHQYSDIDNPFSGVSGDDFEFYRSQSATTEAPPYTYVTPCGNNDWVIEEGPLPNDSQAWAESRAATGQSLFAAAGLPTPTIWETPHYAASAADYEGIDQVYKVRYEQELFFGGQITPGATIDSSHVFGQFFPYVVTDAYGETVIPEDLGNYEPTAAYNNPARPPSVIIANAQAELAVRQGVASFFFHPYYDVTELEQIVQGIEGLGYTFVSAPSMIPGSSLSVASPSTLSTATVGQPYDEMLSATGGTGADTWSLTSGSLPAGLSLNTTTGEITGTPTTAGSSTVTVQAADSSVPTPATASESVTLTINSQALAIDTILPDATVGTAYSQSLTATGGSGGDTWSIVSGNLPDGLSLNTGTGAITGTPTDTLSPAATFKVTDSAGDVATESLGISVNPTTLAVTTTTLPAGTVGQSYNATLAATGGTGADTWTLTSGTLPAGLTLNATTGAITGTPTATASASFTFQATDSYPSGADTATATLTLSITAAKALTISTTSLPAGTAGTAYSETLAAAAGVGTHTWSITKGTLPTGISLNASTGVVAGTPTGASTTALTFKVTDSASPADTATKSLTLTIKADAITISTTSLPAGTAGTAYSETLAAAAGVGTHTWSITKGTLPTGISLNASTGVVAGTPTGASTTALTFKVTDSASPADTATKSLTLTIKADAITISTTSLPAGTARKAYRATLTAAGGLGAHKWSITSGTLAKGLVLNATTGAITGTPSATSNGSITFKVTDSASPADTATKSLTLKVTA